MQLCASDKQAFIFLIHKWPRCYKPFEELMAEPSISKVAVNVATDMAKYRKRFPRARAVAGCIDLRTTVKQLKLKSDKLDELARAVLNLHVDKAVDHRGWESPVLSQRQLMYAATDAWLHWRIEVKAKLLSAAAASDAASGGRASGGGATAGGGGAVGGGDGASGGGTTVGGAGTATASGGGTTVGGTVTATGVTATGATPGGAAAPAREACYRHEDRTRRLERRRGASFDPDPAVIDAIAEAQGSDVPPREDPSESFEADAEADAEADTDSTAATLLSAAKRQIDDFFTSDRKGSLELPSSLSRAARKELHNYADAYALHHRAVGPEGNRQLIISRWRPIEVVLSSSGARVVGALVAREVGPAVVRGKVTVFVEARSVWQLVYKDGYTECVDIDVLNARLARRFNYDHGVDGRGEAAARAEATAAANAAAATFVASGGQPRVGTSETDATWLQQLVDDVDEKWREGRVKYACPHV